MDPDLQGLVTDSDGRGVYSQATPSRLLPLCRGGDAVHRGGNVDKDPQNPSLLPVHLLDPEPDPALTQQVSISSGFQPSRLSH